MQACAAGYALTYVTALKSKLCYDPRSVGQSSLSWSKAPIWCLRPDHYSCQRVETAILMTSCVYFAIS
jgi:hypothetical protein